MQDNSTPNRCGICGQLLTSSDSNKITKKGCDAINAASRERKDDVLVEEGDLVHTECRKNYTHTHYISKRKVELRNENPSPAKKKSLRSHHSFDFRTQCLFCGKSHEPMRNKKKEKLVSVRTHSFRESILKDCEKRKDDHWTSTIRTRLEYAPLWPMIAVVGVLGGQLQSESQALRISGATGKASSCALRPSTST